MSKNLFSKMFIHFLLFQFVLSKRNDIILKNLFIIDIILLKSISVINNVKIKSIIIMLNNQFNK